MLLGQSWKTSIAGWLVIAGDIIAFVNKSLNEQALPTTVFEWVSYGVALAAGIGMILAKDRDVSGTPAVK